MREIPRRRRRTRSALLTAAYTCATQWHWPVVPGVLGYTARSGQPACACGTADCAVPGAHPHDPPLLAATTDARMVQWWWEQRPDAPVVVATGTTVAGVSLPAEAGARVLEYFRVLGVEVGPVVATASRYVLLVAPYTLEELGALLVEQDWVPTSLRYHGPGGYLVLPPSQTGVGAVRWVVPPDVRAGHPPRLPQVRVLLDALVAASTATPDGRRLAF